MKKLTLLLMLGLLTGWVSAQTTTVTGTVTDSDGQAWLGGTFSIFASTLMSPAASGVLDGSGSFSVTVPSNVTYNIAICPNAVSPCGAARVFIAGGSQSVSQAINAAIRPPRFPAIPTNFGYSETEINSSLSPGAQYCNVTLGTYRVWNGGWKNGTACVGSSTITGCAPGSTSNILSGDGSGGCASSGLAASNVTTLNGVQSITGSKTFTSMSVGSMTLTAITGAVQCLQVNSSGLVSGTGAACGSGTGGGTVTSVGLAVPNIFSVTGTPVTGAGTISISLANQSPNFVFAGPTSGGSGAVSFRALVPGDLPIFGSGNSGAVSASGGGTTNFLRADGTWAAPPGGGGGGTPGGSNGQIQFNNSGAFGGDTASTDGAGNITLTSVTGSNAAQNGAFYSNRATSGDVLPANPLTNNVAYTVNGGKPCVLIPAGTCIIIPSTAPFSCQPGLTGGGTAIPAGTISGQFGCQNDSGQTITISAIKCRVDAGTASTVNVANNASTSFLTGPVTCGTSYSNGTLSGTTTIAPGDSFIVTYVMDGTATQIIVDIRGSYPWS